MNNQEIRNSGIKALNDAPGDLTGILVVIHANGGDTPCKHGLAVAGNKNSVICAMINLLVEDKEFRDTVFTAMSEYTQILTQKSVVPVTAEAETEAPNE
jgi:hypothetical protein